MQELEKILEEIKNMLEDNKVIELNSDGTMDKCVIDVKLAWDYIKDIIRKHMNDGWTPVEERLPEDGQTVLCTDGEYVYLVEYDADLDAPFGDIDNITDWQPSPEPRRRKGAEEE